MLFLLLPYKANVNELPVSDTIDIQQQFYPVNCYYPVPNNNSSDNKLFTYDKYFCLTYPY